MATITIPKRLFVRLVETERVFEKLYEDIEDYLLAHDKSFLAKMRRARKAHLEGKIHPLKVR